MLKDIQKFSKHLSSLKRDFSAYIKNKDIPLDERWEMFKTAPDCLSEHSKWIEHFPETFQEFERNLYQQHDRGRFESIHIVEDYLGDNPEKWSKESIDEMKEHFLKENLKTFDYDW